jgi:signal transduction histidine kinase
VLRFAVLSTEVRRSVGAGALGAAVALGVASEWIAYGWDSPIRWLPDLIVGMTLLVAGGWAFPVARGTGALLLATGLAWYAGNLDQMALYWHRAPLIHLLLTYPGWRPSSRLAWASVAVGYLAVLGPAFRTEVGGIAVALALAAALIWRRVTATAGARRHRTVATLAGLALAAALLASGVARLTVADGEAVLPALWLYEVVLCTVAVALCVGARLPSGPVVTDLVVELGEMRSATVRDALARAFGDTSLQVGYWRPAGGGYIDATGAHVVVGGRSVRYIERDGLPYAVVTHDPEVLGDAVLARAVAAATRLSASNEALYAKLRHRVAQVTASRRRLVVAADEERQRIEQRLHDGPQQRLARIRAGLRAIAADHAGTHLRRAVVQLEHTIEELDALARGLHPRDLAGGLAAALRALSDRSPVPVRLSVTDDRYPAEIETAAYYLCAEALANVSKHASATAVSIEVARHDGRLKVVIGDDGVGGADPARGSGLAGLADRVEALGGRLVIDSRPGRGTTVAADFAVDART